MVKSILTYRHRSGVEAGLDLTERDVEFFRFVGKWWCVSADSFVRETVDPAEWEAVYTGDPVDPEVVRLREKWVYSVRRRMNKFAKLEQYSPLRIARVPNAATAYWLAQPGGELIDAPWTSYPGGNTTRARHAWASADVGMSLERLGYTVYSEREFANGHSVLSDPIPGGKFVPEVQDKKDVAKELSVRPDLALAGSGDKFIYIEVERERGAPMAKYVRKLYQYLGEERVGAVWYVVDSPSTAKKIRAAYDEVSAGARDMPLRVMPLKYGAFDYAYVGQWARLAGEDLALIGAGDGGLS